MFDGGATYASAYSPLILLYWWEWWELRSVIKLNWFSKNSTNQTMHISTNEVNVKISNYKMKKLLAVFCELKASA